MKILSLKIISSRGKIVRNIKFKENGLTFVYGNVKRPQDKDSTINSLGKTLLLKMVDYILGCNNDATTMKKEISGYKLIAKVKFKNQIFNVERIINDDTDTPFLVDNNRKTLGEYKDFFEINRAKLDKQVLLSRKNSELSPRERVSKSDFETIFELLSLNEVKKKVSEIYDLQDQLKILEKEKKEVIKNFSKNLTENETLDEKIFIIDKNVQELKDNLEEVSKKISNLDTLPYKDQALKEYEETNKEYKKLKQIVLQSNNEKNRLKRYLEEIKDVRITKDQLTTLFKKAKIEVPQMVLKEIDEVEGFHNSVINDRVNTIEKSIERLEKQIRLDNDVLEKYADDISRLSSILAENRAYQESIALYGDYNNRLQDLLYQQGKLSQAKKISVQVTNLNNDLTESFGKALSVIQDEKTKSVIINYRDFVYNLLQKIYSPNVITYFDIGIRDKHKSRRPVEFTLNMKGETGEGITEVKKNIVDYLVFFFNTDVEILVQDSSCYNGIDPRQVSNMLVELNKLAIKNKKQAIIAINQYQLDSDTKHEVYSLLNSDYGIILDEDNKLLEFDF